MSHSLRVLDCFYICTPRRISTAYPHLSEGRYPQIQGSQNFTLERLRRYILHLDTNHQRAIRSSITSSRGGLIFEFCAAKRGEGIGCNIPSTSVKISRAARWGC